MKLFKNKTVIIVLGVIVGLGILAGGYAIFASRANSQSQNDDQSMNEQVVQKIKPEEVGLTIEATPDKKKVKFAVAKANGIKSMEYQLTYEADSTAAEQSEGGDARVQRGITGQATIKDDESSYASDLLDLGSCSKNVCRYDTGVKSVTLTLKITKDDGKVYEVDKTLDL